jgi:hypothetical protein
MKIMQVKTSLFKFPEKSIQAAQHAQTMDFYELKKKFIFGQTFITPLLLNDPWIENRA